MSINTLSKQETFNNRKSKAFQESRSLEMKKRMQDRRKIEGLKTKPVDSADAYYNELLEEIEGLGL